MISFLTGIVKNTNQLDVVLEVGPLGVEMQVPNAAALTVGKPATLQMYMHWNQENGPTLFGFTSEADKSVFMLIISCSGLGPKIALAVLGDLGAERFLHAIQTGDEASLSKVSGIGAKKSEQMVMQLKHKVAKLLKSGIELQGSDALHHFQDVAEALSSLNYSRNEISSTMKFLQESDAGATGSFDLLMRHALSFLAKKV